MRLRFLIAALSIACLALFWGHRLAGTDSPPEVTAADWGGKVEHCAIAVGMIGGAILSMFANPAAGPIAIGVITAGLVWLTFCE